MLRIAGTTASPWSPFVRAKGARKLVEITPTGGKEPRHFGIDPTGTYLLAANQNSDNIVSFCIDAKTGGLTPTGKVVEAPTPV